MSGRSTRSNSVADEVPLVLSPNFERRIRRNAREMADEGEVFTDASGGTNDAIPLHPPRRTSQQQENRDNKVAIIKTNTQSPLRGTGALGMEQTEKVGRLKAKLLADPDNKEAMDYWCNYQSIYNMMAKLKLTADHSQSTNQPWAEFDKKKLEIATNKILELHRETFQVFPDDDAGDTLQSDGLSLVDELEEACAVVTKQMTSMERAPTTAQSTRPSSSILGIKSPKLEVPRFHGAHADWLSFKENFLNIVHPLEKVNKLRLLQQALQGSPVADFLKDLRLMDHNWQIAWDRLTKRYESPREIFLSSIRPLMELSSIMVQSESGLSKIANIMRTADAQLDEVLKLAPGCAGSKYDMMMTFLICQKMDEKTLEEYSKSEKQYPLPTLERILEFLEYKSKEVAISQEVLSSVSTPSFFQSSDSSELDSE